jgi:hypothetical protein
VDTNGRLKIRTDLRLELREATALTDWLRIGYGDFGEPKRVRLIFSRLGGAEPAKEALRPATHSRKRTNRMLAHTHPVRKLGVLLDIKRPGGP